VIARFARVDRGRPAPWGGILAAAALAVALAWVFWPSLRGLTDRWGDAEYSHGYLVPVFSLYLLWARRGLLPDGPPRSSWWGLPLLAAGLALRFAGTYAFFDWLAAVALLPCLAGVALLLGGGRALRWSWPAIGFLIFMVPLPYRLETGLAHPLQRIATTASTYALQTLGFAAFAEGNVIRLGTIRIGVVEACSGLSMLLIFFALATAVVLVVRRPVLDKALIVVSAVPIAVAANVTRITVTGILHKVAGSYWADLVFHDLAGWLMMPLALGLLWLELRLLAWVLVPVADRRPPAVGPLVRGGPTRKAAKAAAAP
jgi:exosortase